VFVRPETADPGSLGVVVLVTVLRGRTTVTLSHHTSPGCSMTLAVTGWDLLPTSQPLARVSTEYDTRPGMYSMRKPRDPCPPFRVASVKYRRGSRHSGWSGSIAEAGQGFLTIK
jgi:hypothetical protein